MEQKEYGYYLQAQLREIKAYILLKRSFTGMTSDNDLALEWIEKYAESFRKRWRES